MWRMISVFSETVPLTDQKGTRLAARPKPDCPRNCNRRAFLHDATGRTAGKAEGSDDAEVRRPAVSSHPCRATGCWPGAVVRRGDTEVVLPRAGAAAGWSLSSFQPVAPTSPWLMIGLPCAP